MKRLIFIVTAIFAASALGQQGPIATPQINNTYYVGAVQGWYPSIQSAVVAACAGSAARVSIPAASTPTDTIASVTIGCSTAGIVDDRTTPSGCYTWTGSAYVTCAGSNASQINGAVVPASAPLTGTNSSRQIIAVTTVPAAQMPALTGDCTTTAGAVATTCTKTNGTSFGTMATQSASAVAVTGGTLTGVSVNGVTPTTGGTATTYLNAAGGYTTPAGSGSGTVNSGTAFSPAYYGATGPSVSGVTPFAGPGCYSTSAAPALCTSPQLVTALNASPSTLLSASLIPTLNQNTTGTAAALAATPTPCSAGSAPTGILANGDSTGCAGLQPTATAAGQSPVSTAAGITYTAQAVGVLANANTWLQSQTLQSSTAATSILSQSSPIQTYTANIWGASGAGVDPCYIYNAPLTNGANPNMQLQVTCPGSYTTGTHTIAFGNPFTAPSYNRVGHITTTGGDLITQANTCFLTYDVCNIDSGSYSSSGGLVSTTATAPAITTTATAASGASTVTVASATGLQAGMLMQCAGVIFGTGIASGYTSGTSVPITQATTAALSATSCTFTKSTLTVASAAGLAAGMSVQGTGIVAGTYISYGYAGGTTVPISIPTSAALSSGSVSFSMPVLISGVNKRLTGDGRNTVNITYSGITFLLAGYNSAGTQPNNVSGGWTVNCTLSSSICIQNSAAQHLTLRDFGLVGPGGYFSNSAQPGSSQAILFENILYYPEEWTIEDGTIGGFAQAIHFANPLTVSGGTSSYAYGLVSNLHVNMGYPSVGSGTSYIVHVDQNASPYHLKGWQMGFNTSNTTINDAIFYVSGLFQTPQLSIVGENSGANYTLGYVDSTGTFDTCGAMQTYGNSLVTATSTSTSAPSWRTNDCIGGSIFTNVSGAPSFTDPQGNSANPYPQQFPGASFGSGSNSGWYIDTVTNSLSPYVTLENTGARFSIFSAARGAPLTPTSVWDADNLGNTFPKGFPVGKQVVTFTPGTNLNTPTCASGFFCGQLSGAVTFTATGITVAETIFTINFPQAGPSNRVCQYGNMSSLNNSDFAQSTATTSAAGVYYTIALATGTTYQMNYQCQ